MTDVKWDTKNKEISNLKKKKTSVSLIFDFDVKILIGIKAVKRILLNLRVGTKKSPNSHNLIHIKHVYTEGCKQNIFCLLWSCNDWTESHLCLSNNR